ncbi:MAG: class I SAM-dependent methyltransferase [Pseudomonadota bacterium]|nr:class I SAM-dependent methyltransferase [Pseudomonadota bacterium]
MACLLCAHETEEVAGFPALMRVTSDSRIWPAGGRLAICPQCHAVQKPVDSAFQQEAKDIYASYQLYFQSGGSEQKIFTERGARPRSELLLDHLLSLPLPEHCAALDVGCGAGNLLQALSRRRPGWALYGADIGDQRREQILAIHGVKHFFSGDISAIEGRFDIIFLSHVLEHVPSPVAFLRQLAMLLNPGGMLAVLVPHWRENAFDLLVADHCMHFTVPSLHRLLNECGFSILSGGSGLCPKELWAFASLRREEKSPVAIGENNVKAEVDKAIAWLAQARDWAMKCRPHTPLGIFGTAIAATWLTRAAGLAPNFFVDEDKDRQGLAYLGRPVLAPAAVLPESTVLVPLPPGIAENVADRLNRPFGKPVFLVPPAL